MSLIIAVVLAFIGGLILNCMPCVFPVLSLKSISILKKINNFNKLAVKIDGLFYTAGILFSMLILSSFLLMLRSTGSSVGWGYHMQFPIFILVLLYIMFLIGLSFSGFYNIPFILPNVGGQYASREDNIGSFCTGALATLVATPCSAPFMASAIGFALTQPILSFIIIFQSLGLGISLPYLLISFFPNILKFLPKPGRWMETVKQFLSFPMYLSSIWLFWVLIKESNINVILPTLIGLLLLVFSIWLWDFVKLKRKSYFVVFLVLLNFVPFIVFDSIRNMIFIPSEKQTLSTNIIDFSVSRLEDLIQGGNTVLVSVGADWCITCKINEHLLSSKEISNLFKDKKVIYVKADWTKKDKEITDYLMKFKRAGIPLYVLYFHNREGKILPQILSKKILISELQK